MASQYGEVDIDLFSPDMENVLGLNEVAEEAKRLRDSFLEMKAEEARRKILDRSGFRAALEARHNCDVSRARDSLDRICEFKPCTMPSVEKPGVYITWVPMRGYNKITELEEPFMPYFGDEDLAKAQKLYEAMCKDFGSHSAAELPSDGELDEQEATPRKKSRQRELQNDLRSLRLRQAQRYSILSTVERHGDHERVWKTLSDALNIRDIRRVKAIHEVARKRKMEVEEKKRKREEREELTNEIIKALESPKPTETYPPPFTRGSRVTANGDTGHFAVASKYFCFVCWVFACGIHDPRENVEPLEPIPDLRTDNRIEDLSNKTAKPCSQRCFLLEDWLQLPIGKSENDEWTAEEEWLLREAVPIFRSDPCNLALAIGSRPCRAVQKKIRSLEYQQWIEETIRAERRSRHKRADPYYKEQLKKAQRYLVTATQLEKQSKRKSTKVTSARARKSCNGPAQPQVVMENPRFVPCNHPGPCVEGEKNCTCVLKNVHCQSRCGCNGARLTEISSGEIKWKGKDCGRTARGCSCKQGNCLGNTCFCAGDLVACNPDNCTCDCRSLQWDPQARKCRNVDAIYPHHKRTFVGKSKYNLGLFAGDHFEKGELVGVYFGNVLGEELIEKAIRVGQEMNHTYALDLTDDLTIDALQMGSKVRYVNHANSVEEGANCECKFVSIRGDPRAILRTTRAVKPGEEFFFDYKLTHSEGNEWLWQGKSSASK